jgi:Protein of unknown function (DUF4238)
MSKKRNHYLPQVYLEGFTDPETEGKVWQYDKGTLQPQALFPKYLAVRKNLYRLNDQQGNREADSLEDVFCQIEGDFAHLRRKLLKNPVMETADMPTFLAFAVLMKARVPYNLEMIAEMERKALKFFLSELARNAKNFDQFWEKMAAELGLTPAQEASKEQIRQDYLAGAYNPPLDHEMALRAALGSAQAILRDIEDIRWRILTTREDTPFLTCDNPFFYDDPTADPRFLVTRGVGLSNQNVDIILPLSSVLVAVGNRSQPEHTLAASPHLVNEINLRFIGCAQRFVYASFYSKDLQKAVKGKS